MEIHIDRREDEPGFTKYWELGNISLSAIMPHTANELNLVAVESGEVEAHLTIE